MMELITNVVVKDGRQIAQVFVVGGHKVAEVQMPNHVSNDEAWLAAEKLAAQVKVKPEGIYNVYASVHTAHHCGGKPMHTLVSINHFHFASPGQEFINSWLGGECSVLEGWAFGQGAKCKKMYSYKYYGPTDKLDGIKRTRGRFQCWQQDGPLNAWGAVFLNRLSAFFVPHYCLTDETRKRIPPRPCSERKE